MDDQTPKRKLLGQYLLEKGVISEEQLEDALGEAKKTGQKG